MTEWYQVISVVSIEREEEESTQTSQRELEKHHLLLGTVSKFT
jgi:hypothetical protein